MRRNWRANRFTFFVGCLFLCSCMIITSIAGTIAPVEGVLSIPLNFMAGISSSVSQWANNAAGELAEIQSLRDRNAELEEALARFQAELVQQREIVSDYQRLVNLLEYTTSVEDQEFVTADVISYDPSARIRTIIINRGTRNGIEVGMPVVTDQGLVGRITAVTANAARVLLLTDESSFVSARLQNSRAQGSVQGLLTGGLRMIDIPLDAALQVGDIVLTSGLGGNFPADQVIGQVESIRQFEFELGQEAEVRSLIDFDTLELVMVVTSFRPVDLSVFEEDEEN